MQISHIEWCHCSFKNILSALNAINIRKALFFYFVLINQQLGANYRRYMTDYILMLRTRVIPIFQKETKRSCFNSFDKIRFFAYQL